MDPNDKTPTDRELDAMALYFDDDVSREIAEQRSAALRRLDAKIATWTDLPF